jgi:hypothetical protein
MITVTKAGINQISATAEWRKYIWAPLDPVYKILVKLFKITAYNLHKTSEKAQCICCQISEIFQFSSGDVSEL